MEERETYDRRRGRGEEDRVEIGNWRVIWGGSWRTKRKVTLPQSLKSEALCFGLLGVLHYSFFFKKQLHFLIYFREFFFNFILEIINYFLV